MGDSYLKELSSKVLRCNVLSSNRRKEFKSKIPKEASHEVELEDSILFCEGGGQPSDKGKINTTDVLYVGRDTNGSLDVGSDVHVVLDWERRYDHMQQHSGQHLLSALGEQHFGWDTTSWWLGETLCNVEFNPTKKEFPINSTNLLKLESMVNDIIRENRTVQARIVEEEEK